jgi:hypothetical protein
VGIARAVLKDAPILVFDEATSSLDSRSEQAVLDAFAGHGAAAHDAGHCAPPVHGHRCGPDPRSARRAHRGGGRHHDLLVENGYYSRLWLAQQRHDVED